MAKVVSTYTNSTVSLTNPATDNPATVTSTGTIIVNATTAASGVLGNNAAAWSVYNFGTIESIGASGTGISLAAGGFVTNGSAGATTALIAGASTGILMNGTAGQSGTVVNYGTVEGIAAASTGIQINSIPGTVTNLGTIVGGYGVRLAGGGILTNSGLVNGVGDGSDAGVSSFSVAATVVNTGTILATGSTSGTGVDIISGSVNNTGLISGNGGGILISTGAGTVANTGTIAATGVGSIAQVQAHAVTVNHGTIVNGSPSATSALITAYGIGVSGFSSAASVVVINYGTIQTTQTNTTLGGFVAFGIQIGNSASAAITNFGTISSADTNGGAAINLGFGGTVTNAAGGVITAPFEAISTNPGAGLNIVNSGLISQTGNAGIEAIFVNSLSTITNTGTVISVGTTASAIGFGTAGGLLINGTAGGTSGLISGYHIGVGDFQAASNLTVINYGQIRSTQTGTLGGAGVAVQSGVGAGLVVVNFGTISSAETGGGDAITIMGGGAITNTGSGLITGPFQAIFANSAPATVINQGMILSANANATIALNAGGTVNNSGVIKLTLVNHGSVPGGAIQLIGGGVITNTGLIASYTGNANTINVGTLGAFVTNGTAGLITGYHDAIGFFGPPSVSNVGTLTVINSGTIQSTQTVATAGSLNGFAINTGTGTVTTIVNSGVILSSQTAGGGAILLQGPGYILNNAGAVINGAGGNAVSASNVSGATTVVNSGTIKDNSNSSAIYLGRGGIIINNLGGVISNIYHTAISFNNTNSVVSTGTVINAGVIQSTGTGTSGAGIYFRFGGSVTNQGTGSVISSYHNTIQALNSAGNVVNFGTIQHLGTGTSGDAIYFGAGGTVTNYGLISGSHPGSGGNYPGAVDLQTSAALVRNLGTITNAQHANAINLNGGGTVVNGSTGVTNATIYGSHAALSIGFTIGSVPTGGAGVVFNYGTISSTDTISATVALGSGGTVTNRGLIVSANHYAVSFGNTAGSAGGVGTILNFGSIVSNAPTSSASGFAASLNFGGQLTNEGGGSISAARTAVVIGATSTSSAGNVGATITNLGRIIGNVGIAAYLSGQGASTIANYGTIAGTGGIAISLGTVGNELIVLGSASSLQGAISNMVTGDEIDLPSLAFAGNTVGTLGANNVLQVTEGTATVNIALDPNQSIPGGVQFFLSADSGTGTLVTEAVCFCRGTRILTDRGEIAVEDLVVGDLVQTVSGAFKPIRWIGFGRDLVTRANKLARPVVVRQGALADNVPHRDLYLTHGHALYLDGALIPVENLINHRSIMWDETARVVEYFHIELDDHDALLAEGAAAETYYDAGNRALFQNARPGSTAADEKPPFAPVLNGGAEVERVWSDLFARSGGQIATETTDDPDLHLVIDDDRIDARQSDGCTYEFALAAAPAGAVRLTSRSAVPSLLGITAHDHRRLGVAVACIELRQPGVVSVYEHDAPFFVDGGCHPPEATSTWTDGELELPARLFAHMRGAFTVTVRIERPGLRYPLAPHQPAGVKARA